MPLDNINYGAGQDLMQDAFDKTNDAIDAINGIMGGTTDQVPVKVNSTDFNYSLVNSILPASGTANLKVKVIEIGDWNMDANGNPAIAPVHGLADISKVRTMKAFIRNDAGTVITPLDIIDTAGVVSGQANSVNTTTLTLLRIDSGFYDNNGYDSTSYNRGWVTITYEE